MDMKTEIDVARQRQSMRSGIMRDSKQLIGTTVADIYKVTMTALATGLYSIAAMITCLVLYAASYDSTGKTSVVMTYPTLDNSGMDVKKAFMLNPTLWSGVVLAIPIAASLVSVVFRGSVAESYSRGSSMTRWLCESLFSPFVLVLLMAMWGFTDIFTLVGAFTTGHASLVFLSVMDVANYPGRKGVVWWPYYASLWLSGLSILPVILVLVLSAGSTSDMPGLLIASTVLVVISNVMQVVLQRRYYMSVENPSDRQLVDGATTSLIASEVKQLMVGTPLKVTALLLIGLSYTGSDDWTWRHNQATSCLIESTPVNGTTVPLSCVKAGSGLRELSGKKLAAWYKKVEEVPEATTTDYDEGPNYLVKYPYVTLLANAFTDERSTSVPKTCISCASTITGHWCPDDGLCKSETATCGTPTKPVAKISDELHCPKPVTTPVT